MSRLVSTGVDELLWKSKRCICATVYSIAYYKDWFKGRIPYVHLLFNSKWWLVFLQKANMAKVLSLLKDAVLLFT